MAANILDSGKYYLYRYIRKDTNEVFYVGIGSKDSSNFKTPQQEFKRAYNTKARSKRFKNVISKSGFLLEILLESNNYDFIKSKEIEFIKLYKRREDGGTLVNFSEGGESCKGIKRTKENKRNISLSKKGSKNPQARKVLDKKSGIVYGSIKEASVHSKFTYLTLLDKLNPSKPNKINNSNFIYYDC